MEGGPYGCALRCVGCRVCEGVRESLCTREDNHPFFPALQSAAVSAGFSSGLQDLRCPRIASMELRSVCAAL